MCIREMVADGARGFHGQIWHLIQYILTEDECVLVLDDLALVLDDLALYRMAGSARQQLERYLSAAGSGEDGEYSGVSDAIENVTSYFWDDGDVYLYSRCLFDACEMIEFL